MGTTINIKNQITLTGTYKSSRELDSGTAFLGKVGNRDSQILALVVQGNIVGFELDEGDIARYTLLWYGEVEVEVDRIVSLDITVRE